MGLTKDKALTASGLFLLFLLSTLIFILYHISFEQTRLFSLIVFRIVISDPVVMVFLRSTSTGRSDERQCLNFQQFCISHASTRP